MSDVGRPFEFSAVWTINAPLWELEMIGTPGLFDADLNLLALDWAKLQERAAFLRFACRHCQRPIVKVDGMWVDPEASGDDSVWRESCDAHETFVADHEPDA